MAVAIGCPEEHVRRGDVAPLLDWLREHVHPVGRAMNAEELVQKVSGRALTPEPFLSYLEDKLDRVLATSPFGGT
jgi:carboxypeptidase Taq